VDNPRHLIIRSTSSGKEEAHHDIEDIAIEDEEDKWEIPLINRNAIKATYYSANARQIQAVYNYERTILNAYIEVANQLSNISNLEKSYDLKEKEVQALTQSITISTNLFSSARADYMEVLLTQRDAQESKFDLIETKMQ
jgi:outer membrane protein TolC